MAGLPLLFVRGVLLWMVVPLATIGWLLLWPGMRRRRVSLASFLGWADLNLIAALQRGMFWLVTKNPAAWVRWRELPNVTHRLRAIDPA